MSGEGCPLGLLAREACEAEAAALGLQFVNGSWTTPPRGCYYSPSSHVFYYAPHGRGECSANQQCICPATGPPTPREPPTTPPAPPLAPMPALPPNVVRITNGDESCTLGLLTPAACEAEAAAAGAPFGNTSWTSVPGGCYYYFPRDEYWYAAAGSGVCSASYQCVCSTNAPPPAPPMPPPAAPMPAHPPQVTCVTTSAGCPHGTLVEAACRAEATTAGKGFGVTHSTSRPSG
eukprot:4597582-Prymnesium_polylepis.1